VVELQIATPKKIPLVKMILLERCTAQPAPLVLTFGTGHMVTALVRDLCDPCLAHFAVYYVTLCLCPLSVVQVFRIVARKSFVVGPSTVEANLGLTFGADFSFLVNGSAAVWGRTPF